jgi:exopolysaccharide biosynthesis predicted pyruvyltransferase EpsI
MTPDEGDVAAARVLAECAAAHPGAPLLFRPNPGNAGDSAINCAAYRLFDRLGCRVEVVDADVPAARTRGRVLVHGGGGNLVPLYDAASRFIARHHAGCAQLVLLPHTIRGHEALLGALGSNVTLLCREAESLDHARRHAPAARVLPAHDLVFGLDAAALAAHAGGDAAAPFEPVALLKRNLRQAAHRLRNLGRGRELEAFRADAESAGRARAFRNLDVSGVFAMRDMSPASALAATRRTLAFLDRFDRVRTDRLHVAILSALLGKEVELHDNAYGKNRAVYEHSMRDRFPHVRLAA